MKKSLLISAMLIGGACAAWAAEPDIMTSSPYQGSAIETGGTYYLYNVETGTWLDGNDQVPTQWSATGALNKIGFDIKLDKPAGYAGYTIFCNTTGNGMLRGHDSGDEYPFGLDGNDAEPTDWLIEPKEGSSIPNAYTIRVEALDGTISEAYYLGASWSEDLNLYKLARDSKEGYSTWQFVTRDERIKQMVEDAKANPDGVDASWLIPNHNMMTSNKRDDVCWQGTTGWPGFVDSNNLNNTTGIDGRGLVSREGWQAIVDRYTVIEGLPEGAYSFSVNGFYREGNPWASGKTDGPFDNKAWYYAGATYALVMNAFDDAQPQADKANGYSETVGDCGKFFPGYGAGVCFHNGHYKNAPLTTNVSANGKLILGLWKSEIIAEDSFNFKQMHLTYKAAKADEDLTVFKTRINDLIAEGEGYGNIPGLADAIAAAKAALNGSASDMMIAIRPLANVVSTAKKFASYKDIFTRTKALCPEGTDVSKAQALYDAATNDDEFNNAIKTLRIIRRMAEMPRVADMYKGASAIPEGGIFYLYNVGQKQFLDGGAEWAAHAIFDSPGAEFTAEDINGLQCALSNNFTSSATNHYFASWGSLDGGKEDNFSWEFVPVDGQENVFRLRKSSNHEHLIYIPFSRPQNSDCERALSTATPEDKIDPADQNAWWKIVTKEERDAMLQNASLNNPIDASHHIVDPGFNRIIYAANPDAWSKSGAEFNSQWGNFVSETMEITKIDPEFELFQEIPGGELPYGVYVIECNGYFRDGNINEQADREPARPVRFFTNDTESSVELFNILDHADKAPGEGQKVTSKAGKTYEVPADFNQGVAYFRSGLYKNQIVTNFQKGVDDIEDPGLWIGLEYSDEADAPAEGAYVNVDNFRVTYYGNNTTVEAVKEAINAGINDIIIDEPAAAAADNRIFNLQGIQVANPTAPGIYICNGKKFVVR